MTIAFLVVSYGVAMSVTDLGIILALVGATGSTMVSYILPGAIYYRLHTEPHFLRSVALAIFCVGACLL